MRTALVTGASRGIGLGIARELATQGFGLTISARGAEALEEAAVELRSLGAPDVLVAPSNLARREEVGALVAAHAERFETMDVLVLNGGVGTAGPLHELREKDLDRTLEVNLASSLLLARDSLPLLMRAGESAPTGARVVVLSSLTGVYAEPGLSVYGATKAGLVSLSDSINAEYASRGVMSTAIAPGYVATAMSEWITGEIPADTMTTVDDIVSMVRMVVGLGRNTVLGQLTVTRATSGGYRA